MGAAFWFGVFTGFLVSYVALGVCILLCAAAKRGERS